MTAPHCRLCGSNHWARDGCTFKSAAVKEKALSAAPKKRPKVTKKAKRK